MASAFPDEPRRVVVLVVEDEPLLRLHAVDLLEDAGFDPVEAGSAAQAIEILHARPDIRVVFTDIDMPGDMNGLRLAAAIRDRWPPVQIIITSGMVRPLADELPERGVFFAKPYRDSKLIEAVRAFTT